MQEAEVSLKIEGVSISFPGVKALDNVHFELKKGEVHALIGENGAGKSTLMKILSGLYKMDEGEIIVNGRPDKLGSPRHSEELGISIVYQELNNFPEMSVSENITVGQTPLTRIHSIDYRRCDKLTQQLLDEFELSDLNPKTRIRDLSVGRQQIVEILKAISHDANILIFDEPTSALTTHETDLLFKNIRQLKKRGVSVIYITHRLDELYEICDRVTVFRDGKYVGTKRMQDTNKSELVRMMVGRDVSYNYGAHTTEPGEVLLDVKNISYGDIVKNVSFQLHAGEVLGVSGLEGAGRSELGETLFGSLRKTDGKTFVLGREIDICNTLTAKYNSMAYITKDRKIVGLFMDDTINNNIMSANLDKFTRLGFIRYGEAIRNSEYYGKRFTIRTPSLKKMVRGLSGGNQQKVLLAMWFTRNPKILIIDEPTRGIDVGAKEEIHRLIRQLAADGAGIIMISSDLTEILGASDRIMIMYEGRMTSIIENTPNLTEERIIQLASGMD